MYLLQKIKNTTEKMLWFFHNEHELPYRMNEQFKDKLPLRISHTIIPPGYTNKEII